MKAKRLAWQQIPSSIVTEILCGGYLDGVVLDLEHGCYSNETIYSCIQVGTCMGKSVYVRVATLDKTLIRMSLDAGCSGIILSTVETFDDAKDFFEYCKYPPKGRRGQGLVRENFWGKSSLGCSSAELIPMIETVEGVREIREIMSFDFDYYLVGPYDLSASCGDVGNFQSEEFLLSMKLLKENCQEKLAFHIVTDIPEMMEKYADLGFLALSMDTLFLKDGIENIEIALREIK